MIALTYPNFNGKNDSIQLGMCLHSPTLFCFSDNHEVAHLPREGEKSFPHMPIYDHQTLCFPLNTWRGKGQCNLLTGFIFQKNT